MEAIRTVNLSKRFAKTVAVSGLTLSIAEGEFYGLLGANGAGKTTTIKMLTTLLKPTSGEAWILENDLRRRPERIREMISVAPQELSVAKHLSVKENLDFICGVNGFGKARTRVRTEEALAEFGLEPIARRRAGILSGGQKRRLSLAMAFITQPRILFLDEPTLGLDILSRFDLWDALKTLKSKTTIVLTTHYLEEAVELSDRIGVMVGGELAASGTAAQITREYSAESFQEAFIRLVRGGVK